MPHIIISGVILMSKREKLIEKLKNNPNNIKFETIQELLLFFGFKQRQPSSGSSHYTFILNSTIITIPKHKPLKSVYVKRVIDILEELGLINKE
jgi:dTDP-4-amino-4,6-dideoxygalactose transaminase